MKLFCPAIDIDIRGISRFAHFLVSVRKCVPDITHSVHDIQFTSERVAHVHCTVSGTKVSELGDHPIFPLRKHVAWKCLMVMTFDEAGRVSGYATHFLFDPGMKPSLPEFHALASSAPCMAFTDLGSRLLQDVMEAMPSEGLLDQLCGRVVKASRSRHANHVLQKYVGTVQPELLQFIVDEFRGEAVAIASHSISCRVLQRLLECCSPEQVAPLVEELLAAAGELLTHPFGNFVVQCMLEFGSPQTKHQLIRILCSSARTYARHWICSNVVRCALIHCSQEDKGALANAIAPTEKELSKLKKHRFGNFIAREIKMVRQALG